MHRGRRGCGRSNNLRMRRLNESGEPCRPATRPPPVKNEVMTSANWAGNYNYRAKRTRRPGTIAELQDIVGGATQIKALGSRHSFNDIADSAGDQVVLDALPAEIEIDRDRNSVTVSGSARYGDFAEQLHRAGYAIHNLASLPHISVAGAVATGSHGSGDHNGNLATAVCGLELVTGDGSIVSVKRGDAHFEGMVVALGALGIVTRVSLDIQPTFQVRQDVYDGLGWSQLYDHFDAITSTAYSVSLFTNWGEAGVDQVWLKSRANVGAGAGSTQAGEPEFFGATAAGEARHPLTGVSPVSTTEQLGVPGPWWNRLAHFRLDFTPSHGEELQTEYLVPRQNAIDAIDAIRGLAARIAPHLYVSEFRTMAADDLWLSPSYGRDSVGIHFTWKPEPDAVAAVLPAIDAALVPFDARPHWGKLFETDASRLDSRYPRLPDFRQLADRLDPQGKFRNDYLERLVFSPRQ